MRGTSMARGAALGIFSALAVGGLASPAGAQEPTAVANCTGTNTLSATISNFPGNEVFTWLAVINPSTGPNRVIDGFAFTTDGSGTATTPSASFDLAVDLGFIVYRDTDGNNRWHADIDDTVYRGSGNIPTTCPPSVTLTPK